MNKYEFIAASDHDIRALSNNDCELVRCLRNGRVNRVPVMDAIRLRQVAINAQIASVLARGDDRLDFSSVKQQIDESTGARIDQHIDGNLPQ